MQVDKLRWWNIYREPEHELVGKLQLYINYSTSSDDNNPRVSYFVLGAFYKISLYAEEFSINYCAIIELELGFSNTRY